jgi:hypothetical protein
MKENRLDGLYLAGRMATNSLTPDHGFSSDLAPKFYPAVSSLLAFGLPCLAVEANWRGALGIAQRQIPARMEGEGVLGRCLSSLKIKKPQAVWVKPSLLAEVEYRARSANGRLRHPTFKGIREDL